MRGCGSCPAFPSPPFCTSAAGVVLPDVLGQQDCALCRGTVLAWHRSWLRARWGLSCHLLGSFFSDFDEKNDGCVSVAVTSDNGDQGGEPVPVSGLGSNQWDSKLVVLTAPEYGLAGAEENR